MSFDTFFKSNGLSIAVLVSLIVKMSSDTGMGTETFSTNKKSGFMFVDQSQERAPAWFYFKYFGTI